MELRFCEWLDSIKEREGYSIQKMSTMVGIANSTVNSHIHGTKFPKIFSFVKYMRAFGVPYIWSKTPEMPNMAYAMKYNSFKITEDKYNNFYKEEDDE